MSQEGANLPQEVEGSHEQATAPHGSIPADAGSPTATVTPVGSNPSSVSEMASAVNNAGTSERASPAVLSAGEDINATSSKIASQTVLQDGEEDNSAPKIASPAVLLVGEEKIAEFKPASPTVLLADEEKGSNTGPKLASPTILQDCDKSKAGSHASEDNNNAARSKLASPAVLHAGDGNNCGSKISSPAVPQATADSTARSKLDNSAVPHAVEHNNAGFKVPNPAVLHASKDMDNNAGRHKFASPGSVLLRAGEDKKTRTKLAIQAMSHAGGNAGSTRLTRSVAAALHAAKDNASKLPIQMVPRLHAGKDNNIAGSSKAVARPAAVDAGESSAKEGKNNVARGKRADEAADMGSGRGKGNAAAVQDVDHDLHIFTERERRKKMKNMFSTLHGLLPQLPDKADKATIVGETIIYIRALEKTLKKMERRKMERNRALAAQQHGQQQQLVLGAGSSSRASSSARHPTLALPAPAPASASWEVNLADMVHNLQAKQTAVAAVNRALMTAAAARAGGGASSSSSATMPQLPRGAVPFPAPAAGFQTWSGANAVVSVANNEAYINLRCPREPSTLTKALFVLDRYKIEVVTTTISAQDGFRMYGIHARATPASPLASFPENLCAEDRFKMAVSEMLQLINL